MSTETTSTATVDGGTSSNAPLSIIIDAPRLFSARINDHADHPLNSADDSDSDSVNSDYSGKMSPPSPRSSVGEESERDDLDDLVLVPTDDGEVYIHLTRTIVLDGSAEVTLTEPQNAQAGVVEMTVIAEELAELLHPLLGWDETDHESEQEGSTTTDDVE